MFIQQPKAGLDQPLLTLSSGSSHQTSLLLEKGGINIDSMVLRTMTFTVFLG